jgi:hypothetical protein
MPERELRELRALLEHYRQACYERQYVLTYIDETIRMINQDLAVFTLRLWEVVPRAIR